MLHLISGFKDKMGQPLTVLVWGRLREIPTNNLGSSTCLLFLLKGVDCPSALGPWSLSDEGILPRRTPVGPTWGGGANNTQMLSSRDLG